jgi:hypothetical protein
VTNPNLRKVWLIYVLQHSGQRTVYIRSIRVLGAEVSTGHVSASRQSRL